jgi:phage N-6-adenine-methyltransferase
MSTFQLLPTLAHDDYAALKADIAERGVMVAVEYDEEGNVIDGHHRIRICEELGISDWPRIVRSYADDAAKRTQARRLNLARRHLDQAARRALIEDELRDRPERSDRQVAAELGVDHKTVGATRERLEHRGEIPHHETRVGRDGVEQPARKPSVSRVDYPGKAALHRASFLTGNAEWYTPPSYLDLAREVLGGIDLDPASNDIAQKTVGATQYFTADNNGLSKEWIGRIWLNPPYAQPAIERFTDKLLAERRAGRTTSAIMLTNDCTDTAWYQKAVRAADAFCLLRGRVSFIAPDGITRSSPTQGQTFFYYGDSPDLFGSVFGRIGYVGGAQ